MTCTKIRAALAANVVVVALVATIAAPQISWAIGVTQIIVQTGDAVPDGDGQFQDFYSRTVLNNRGEVAFLADLTGTSRAEEDDSGIYLASLQGGVSQIVREGGALPGGDASFSAFNGPALNDAGQVLVQATYVGTPNGVGLFLSDGQNLQMETIARSNQSPPDGNGQFFSVNVPTLNKVGQVAFAANLTNTHGGISDTRGVFLGDEARLAQLARRGETIPGGSDVFNSFSFHVAVNDLNQSLFVAELTPIAGLASDVRGIFLHDGASLRQVVAEGDASGSSSATIDAIVADEVVTLNNVGQFTFVADLAGTPQGQQDNRAFFLSDGQTHREMLREGWPAPDGNGVIDQTTTTPVLNQVGQMAVVTQFRDTSGGSRDRSGLLRIDGDQIVQIARSGQLTPDGTLVLGGMSSVAMNDGGQVSFLANLNTQFGAGRGNGIFFYEDGLGLVEVARENESMLGSTIAELGFAGTMGNGSDNDTGLALDGQLAYVFRLRDGRSGIALWTIPEPASCILIFAGLFGLLAGRGWGRKGEGRKGVRESAGINRLGIGNARVLHGRTSHSPWPRAVRCRW